MTPISLLDLPKELLSLILNHLSTSELCSPALVCGLLNILCEEKIYQSVSVVKYAYSHSGYTRYSSIRCFFNAIKKRPLRLSYIKNVKARLELRMDLGLHHACELFEALLKMPHLTDLCIEIVGGVKPHREHRSLEQSMIWGCTFERGRTAIYKFFRMSVESEDRRGLHALHNLRSLKVLFPSNSIGLQTDLMAYSALQHNSITRLELKHIVNAALAPPKLPRLSSTITHLTVHGCKLPLRAYQSIFESISALEYLDYRPARPMGCLGPGGLVNALARHRERLQSLSIKADTAEMMGLDLSAFTSLTHLQIHNPVWNEDAMNTSQSGILESITMPAAFPPFLDTLALKNFHVCTFVELIKWMETELASLIITVVPHLKELRLEAEHLGNEYTFDSYPMYLTSASAFHVNARVLAIGTRLYRESGVKVTVQDTLLFGQEALAPGPYETGPECMTLRLNWDCRPPFEGSDDMVKCAKVEMYPKGAVERLLLLRGNTLDGQLSWQDL